MEIISLMTRLFSCDDSGVQKRKTKEMCVCIFIKNSYSQFFFHREFPTTIVSEMSHPLGLSTICRSNIGTIFSLGGD